MNEVHLNDKSHTKRCLAFESRDSLPKIEDSDDLIELRGAMMCWPNRTASTILSDVPAPLRELLENCTLAEAGRRGGVLKLKSPGRWAPSQQLQATAPPLPTKLAAKRKILAKVAAELGNNDSGSGGAKRAKGGRGGKRVSQAERDAVLLLGRMSPVNNTVK